MLLRLRRKRSAYALLAGMYTRATPMETYCGGSSRNLRELLCDPLSQSLSQREICIPMFTEALFTVALV